MRFLFLKCGLVFGLLTTFSEANEVERLLLFGDSYIDTGAGNALAEAIGQPPPNPQPPYSNNRHSNGPIWIDYLTEALHLPYCNYAVSGTTTGTGNSGNPALGGISNEIDRFQSKNKRIKKDTLVMLDGGGNDFLILADDPSKQSPAGIATAILEGVANMTTNFQRLQTLGAKNIIYADLIDLGKLPFAVFSPVGPVLSVASEVFNETITPLIRQLNENASNHQQIFILDTFTIFNQVLKELQAQGVDITSATLPNGPQPNNLAFYDSVHPTTLFWETFSKYASAYVDTFSNGTRFIAAEQDLAYETIRAHHDLVENRIRSLYTSKYIFGGGCCPEEDCCDHCHFDVYLEGEAKWGRTKSRRSALGLKYDAQLLMGGVDYIHDCFWTVGASFSAERSDGRAKRHRGHIKINDFTPTLYALYTQPEYFIEADVSYHFLRFHDIKRTLPLLNKHTKGHTQGQAFDANIQIGTVGRCGCLTLIPLLGAGYEQLHIDKYKEKHAGFLNLHVHGQRQHAFVGRLGSEFYIEMCDGQLSPYAGIFYEFAFSGNRKGWKAHFQDSTDGAIMHNTTSLPFRDAVRTIVGVNAHVNSCITSNLTYEGEYTFRNYNQALKLQFDVAF